MTKRSGGTLLRALFGGWGAALIVLSYSAVAVCDSCGGGGDEAFRWLGAISGVVAIVIVVSRGTPRGLKWVLLAIQVGLLVAAYKSAGAGSGSVRISPALVAVAAVFETIGLATVAAEDRKQRGREGGQSGGEVSEGDEWT